MDETRERGLGRPDALELGYIDGQRIPPFFLPKIRIPSSSSRSNTQYIHTHLPVSCLLPSSMTTKQSDSNIASSFCSSYLDIYRPAPSPTKHRRRHTLPLQATTTTVSLSIMPPYSKYCCQCGGMLVISDKCASCAHTECTKCL